MAPKLYYYPGSPPCQVVMLIAKHLNLELEIKEMTSKEELNSPEFLKINPSHTVPFLDDNGLHLPESRVIAIYLLEQYGKDDSLLPKDPKTKALVNQRLLFDLGTLWQRCYAILSTLLHSESAPPKEKYTQLEEALGFLNTFLEGHKWLAGDKISIADYVTVISVSYIDIIPGIELSKYLNVVSWFEMTKQTIKHYDEVVAPQVKCRREKFAEKHKN